MDLHAGDRLGPFVILEEIGHGGMAVVYKARDTANGQIVALKVLKPYLQHDSEFVRRFLDEAHNTAALRHPHIVSTFTAGHADDHYYMAMEYLAGGSLAQRLRGDQPLDFAQSLMVVEQIAAALDYIHGQPLIHRDLKPSNILFAHAGLVKLADFGIARSRDRLTMTMPGTLMGTPEYMSPEQALGREIGTATDIWSLGVVLFEMLTGRVPFEGDGPHATLFQVVHEEPTPPSQLNPTLPPAADTVVQRCLAKSAAERYPRAGDLATGLHLAWTGGPDAPTVIQRPTPPRQLEPQPTGQARRSMLGLPREIVVGVALALFLLLAALLTVPRWLEGRSGPSATTATGPAPTAVLALADPSSPTPLPVPTETLVPTAAPTETPVPPTSPPTASRTVGPTRTATSIPTPPVAVTLLGPANGATLTGSVLFQFLGNLAAAPGGVFDVRVCQGDTCQPQFGITNTTDTAWAWTPNGGPGVYRWQVLIIDRETKQPRTGSSPVWQFAWQGGGGGGGEDGGGDDGGGGGGGAGATSTPR